MQLPSAFKTKYQQLLGNEASAFLAALNEQSLSGFRVNPLKDALPQETISQADGKVPYVPTGYYGQVNGKSLDHVTGWVYSQEPSAMCVGEVVNPQPGERVLDLCAAPGGKSTHLISLMKDQGLLVANEIFRKRALILAENLERWGTRNTVVMNESPEKLEKQFPKFFDRILIDAPCSGEGMFRKEPAGIEYWNSDYPAECANRQRKIIASAIRMLKPGGILVYSTCTFAPEEDEQNASWILENYPAMQMEEVKAFPGMDHGRPEWADGNPELAKAIRLFPHHIKGEGHFIAKFRYGTPVVEKPLRKKRRKKKHASSYSLTRNQQELFNDFRDTVIPDYQPTRLVLFGEQLYDLPVGIDKIDDLNILRPGLHLGTFKKRRFEPSLALALALKPTEVKKTLELSEEQWRQYVHGDTITIDKELASGWYLLVCNNHSCGFGKLVQRTVKNFYPKGLRF